MPLILNLETTGDVLSVCLSKNGEIISEFISSQERSHSEELVPAVNQVLERAGILPKQLDAIALTSGPGSYTGIRVGSSFAKASCLALGCNLIAVPSTLVQANAFIDSSSNDFANSIIVSTIDARRMEIWYSVYDKQLNQLEKVQAAIPDNDFLRFMYPTKEIIVSGNGAEKLKSVLYDKSYHFDTNYRINAIELSKISLKYCKSWIYTNIMTFTPIYGKDFFLPKNQHSFKIFK